MNELKKRIENIKEDLEFFDDELEKYEYIIDLGKKLKDIDEKYKNEEYLVKGCTSLVWLKAEYKDGKIYFEGTSDAIIVKGLVQIMISIFSNTKLEDLISFDKSLLEELKLKEIVTPNRQSGLAGMLDKIISYAKDYHAKS